MHTQFSWENFLKGEALEMNRTDNKIHLRNTGDKHVNLIKLAHYFINDGNASCYFNAYSFWKDFSQMITFRKKN